IGSFDGFASGVVLADNGRLDVLASTGAPKPLFGGQINGFSGVSVNQRGEVLTYINTTNNSGIPSTNGLMLLSREGNRTLMISGSDSVNINNNGVARFSLNDNGDVVFLGNNANGQGVFRLAAGRAIEQIWSSSAPLPAVPA